VRQLYTGPLAADGTVLFPGLERGSERGWGFASGTQPMALALDTYRYFVFGDPDWNYLAFDPATDIPLAEQRIGPVMNSADPDLSAFGGRGGKLILYHGWNDPGIPPRSTVRYYDSVRERLGAETSRDAVRLFMVPGMNHCRGGVGTDQFDAVGALDRWLASGEAPTRIEASRVEDGAVVRSRPLCPYPQVAVYDGGGSSDAAENFSCR
jgi:feruloyl esterase